MIQIQNLTKRYGSATVVDGLSFQVRPGQVTGFLGPNGAGKSTTMRMILGLDRPDAGSALIEGERYADLERPLTHVGSLLDASWVHAQRTARNHLRWLAASNGIPERRVDEVLERVGLTGVARKRVGTFSLGMKQRLGLAGALLGDPQHLLFDEPVNGLDPEGIVWIRRTMKSLATEGRTVLVSSHLLSEMAQTADHLVVIAQGALVADTSTEAFIAQSSRQVIRLRVKDSARAREVLARAQVSCTPVDVSQPDGPLHVEGATVERLGELLGAAGVVVFEMSVEQGSLEEAFMELTRDHVDYRGEQTRQEVTL